MNLKEYIKFRKIFKYCSKNGCQFFSSRNINLKANQLYYLRAKGLITTEPYKAGDPYCKIIISDNGLKYYDEVLASFFAYCVPTLISLAALIVSIISLLQKQTTMCPMR